jgi:hypothetical protein
VETQQKPVPPAPMGALGRPVRAYVPVAVRWAAAPEIVNAAERDDVRRKSSALIGSGDRSYGGSCNPVRIRRGASSAFSSPRFGIFRTRFFPRDGPAK